jgi:hypothetical protein
MHHDDVTAEQGHDKCFDGFAAMNRLITKLRGVYPAPVSHASLLRGRMSEANLHIVSCMLS